MVAYACTFASEPSSSQSTNSRPVLALPQCDEGKSYQRHVHVVPAENEILPEQEIAQQ